MSMNVESCAPSAPVPRHPHRTFRLGTRASKLARTQSATVRAWLERLNAHDAFVEVLLNSAGDLDPTTPLPQIGGEGLFTSALEHALHANEIDLAVHSLKDVPIKQPESLTLAAIALREDPRDVLIAQHDWTLATLPRGARVGTCSHRRSAQLLAIRPDVAILPLRGNVDTRVRQLRSGAFDAIVLAAAGVHRIGLREMISEYLPLEQMLPAPAQGALTVQCRTDDPIARAAIALLDEPAVRAATAAERGFLEGLGGGCTAPIAAYAEAEGAALRLHASVASLDGTTILRFEGSGSHTDGRAIGLDLAARALAEGAGALLT
jgi:hydroxymethylbilane synthase